MKTLGIDLGTTNSVAAIDAEVLQHAAGRDTSPIVPSSVAFPPSGATLVGIMAKRRRAIDPQNTVFSAKRVMGQRWLSYAATKFKKQYPFRLQESPQGGCLFRTRAGTFSPQEIGALVVGKLLAGHTIQPKQFQGIISVPAAFDTKAREATLSAALKAGLHEPRLVEEPVATAMAYATMRGGPQRYVAVYDLGGGTFDVAIVDCSQQPARVVAHGGDPYLGGDDIDVALADWAVDRVLQEHNWDLRTDPEVYDRLVVQCERAKIRLGFAAQTSIALGQVDPAAPVASESIELERQQLVALCSDLVSRTFIACDQVLREAKLSTADIEAVYLAGGTTLLPHVREAAAQYFSALPRCEFDPMEVVAIGASLM